MTLPLTVNEKLIWLLVWPSGCNAVMGLMVVALGGYSNSNSDSKSFNHPTRGNFVVVKAGS